MNVQKFAIKMFVESDVFKPSEFVPLFHHWIQTQALEGYLLIDVADYAHVVAGPGTLLVSSQANIHMDRTENRLGLLYVRKQPLNGGLAAVLRETFTIAEKMEQEPAMLGRLKFRTNEISIRLNDRLLAPNTPQTFEAVKPEVQAVVKELYESANIEHRQTPPGTLLEISVKAAQFPPLETLLERLGHSHLSV